MPSISTAPSSTSYSRGTQVGGRGLARAGVAHERHQLTRLDREVDALERERDARRGLGVLEPPPATARPTLGLDGAPAPSSRLRAVGHGRSPSASADGRRRG